MIGVYIAAGVVGLLLIAFAVSYDRFVRQRNLIKNSWANVDTELRRRYDLIPNLVEAVKGYAAHEKEIFEKLAQARAAAIAPSRGCSTSKSSSTSRSTRRSRAPAPRRWISLRTPARRSRFARAIDACQDSPASAPDYANPHPLLGISASDRRGLG